MSTKVNIIGQTFNRLTVRSETTSTHGHAAFLCDCECGKTNIAVRGDYLRNGKTKSCGCLDAERRPNLELEGQIFGRLKVERLAAAEESIKSGQRIRKSYLCICECSKEIVIRADRLQNGHTKSCGCLGLDNMFKLKEPQELSAEDKRLYEVFLTGFDNGDLTFTEFCNLTKQSCTFCGNLGKEQSNLILRLNTKFPYRKDNVVPACSVCIAAKEKSTTYS